MIKFQKQQNPLFTMRRKWMVLCHRGRTCPLSNRKASHRIRMQTRLKGSALTRSTTS
ncbi:hypothetical protein X975_26718, partial [Stegodyphus mimosarum]